MLELRPYQCVLLPDVQIALTDAPQAHLLMQFPTGGGKTITAGALLADWLRDGCKAASAGMAVFLLGGLVSSQTTNQNIETT